MQNVSASGWTLSARAVTPASFAGAGFPAPRLVPSFASGNTGGHKPLARRESVAAGFFRNTLGALSGAPTTTVGAVVGLQRNTP